MSDNSNVENPSAEDQAAAAAIAAAVAKLEQGDPGDEAPETPPEPQDVGWEDVSSFFDQSPKVEIPYGLEGEHVLIPNLMTQNGLQTTSALVVITGLGFPYPIAPAGREGRSTLSRLTAEAGAARVTVQSDSLGTLSHNGVIVGNINTWNGREATPERVVFTGTDGVEALYPTNLIPEIGKGGPIMIMMSDDRLGGSLTVNNRGKAYNGQFGSHFFKLVQTCLDMKDRAIDPAPEQARKLFNALSVYAARAYPAEIEARNNEAGDVQLRSKKGPASFGEAVIEELRHRMNPESVSTDSLGVLAGNSDYNIFGMEA